MSLAHAVLTSLLEKPSSGYDLARRFDKSIGYFWHATHQQIYRELARMERAGWIESSIPADAGKTRKKEYRVLPAGRTELARWAVQSAPPAELRDEFMVKLRADAVLSEVDLRPELARHLALHQEKLAHYLAIEARDFPTTRTLSRHARIQHMILKKGILFEQGSVAWTQEMLCLLEQLAAPAAHP
ncbi:MAG: PadR family transcriptional regulator [Burkholderiaceae bacterium]|jgi:DNA-binding PadR family transcriptional regulator|nr:PadR family transcriptional regulator [Burkholderiaceae bacterium]MCO5104341.1 PadR family transcriptional regulator [Burkholderiaceae bacterium]